MEALLARMLSPFPNGNTTRNSTINDYVYDPKTSRKGLQ